VESLENLVWQRDNRFEEHLRTGFNLKGPKWWDMPTGTPILPRVGWWELPAGGPIEPLAQTVVAALRELALPDIQRELARPLDARWVPEAR
jgi:hypothetical protein